MGGLQCAIAQQRHKLGPLLPEAPGAASSTHQPTPTTLMLFSSSRLTFTVGHRQ